MTARPPRHPANRPARRGVTLVEMLVTVGLLVLVMTILVQIFQSATGALSAQRAYAGLDQDIRRADTFLRQDLAGTTAKMTPPLNPADGLGYFTYGENALADLQGEDTDDYMAFTAQAPPGRPFSGTMMVASDQLNTTSGLPSSYKRVPISSEFAEIVYFLRNGNLYRRVFLILPKELQSGVNGGTPLGTGLGWGYNGGSLSGIPPVQPGTGLYGLPVGWLGLNDLSARPSAFSTTASYAPILNSLGDLTNRENRAFNPRFANDYINNGTGALIPDGIPDDQNGDGVPDYYPTMYPHLSALVGVNWTAGQLIPYAPSIVWNPNRLAFPYVYPYDFSRPDPNTTAYRRSHSLDPAVNPVANATYPALGTYRHPAYNHAPLDLDDPLGTPTAGQTWWGFPTKKETLSPYWTDPVKRLNDPAGMPMTNIDPAYQQSFSFTTPLPPMSDAVRGAGQGQPFAATSSTQGDVTPAGSATFTPANFPTPPTPALEYFQAIVEEDLILTGVRSFDIKAFDPSMEAYMDLGYMNMVNGTTPTVDVNFDGAADYWTLRTFAHEGRIPPLTTDLRSDPQAPAQNPNIGDDDANVVRLTRVWDTWSTDYTNTPLQLIGTAIAPMLKPALPSYPPPYPIPLRGIQINIRVVDPGNERIKQITIRQDFSSKL